MAWSDFGREGIEPLPMDGDQQMLEWTAAGSGARFMGLVHHTDAEREWAYDRKSPLGTLDRALDGGHVVSFEAHGKAAAELAARLLAGERPRPMGRGHERPHVRRAPARALGD